MSHGQLFRAVRERVSAEEAAIFYAGADAVRYHKMICPYHDDKEPSLRFYRDGRFFCFACRASGDCTDIVARLKSCSPALAALMINDDFRLGLDEEGEPVFPDRRGTLPARFPSARTEARKREPARAVDPDELRRRRAYVERCAEALPGSEGEAYLMGRCFSPETLRRFRMGYDAVSRRVVLPYDPKASYYTGRAIDEAIKQRYHGASGPEPLFNPGALRAGGPVFVTEGPFCAVSIVQAGKPAVSICGAHGGARLLDRLRDLPEDASLLLCLDTDDVGAAASVEIGEALDRAGVRWTDVSDIVMGTGPDRRNDPNEVLMTDGPETFAQRIRTASHKSG